MILRGKAEKGGVRFKPGSQDGKLVIFQRKCAYGECTECGVEKFFMAHKCPLE